MAEADPERFLDDLDSVPYADLKSRLSSCWSEEGGLSYARRRLHSTMDVLRWELERRAQGQGEESDDVVDRLKKILGGGPGGSRGARPRDPDPEAHRAADERIDALLPDAYLARLPDAPTGEVEGVVERLMAEERSVSARRRQLHSVIDALEAEVARRYKAGLTTPDEILGGGPPSETRKN